MNLDSINHAMFEGMDAYCTLSVERMDEIGIGEILQKRFGIHRQKNTWLEIYQHWMKIGLQNNIYIYG